MMMNWEADIYGPDSQWIIILHSSSRSSKAWDLLQSHYDSNCCPIASNLLNETI